MKCIFKGMSYPPGFVIDIMDGNKKIKQEIFPLDETWSIDSFLLDECRYDRFYECKLVECTAPNGFIYKRIIRA